MADEIDVDLGAVGDSVLDTIDALGGAIKKGQELAAEGQKLLGDLGISPTPATSRTADGGWNIGGEKFAGNATTWGGTCGDVQNSALPDWFPFGAFVAQRDAYRKTNNASFSPERCANTLVAWVVAGADAKQVAQFAAGTGAEGLATSDPAKMGPDEVRAYWMGVLLVASIAADCPAYNAIRDALEETWKADGACKYRALDTSATKGLSEQQLRDLGICVGVWEKGAKAPTATQDKFGRLVSPGCNEYVERAKAMLRWALTGETMQQQGAGAGSFAGFEDCVRSGNSECLTAYQPQSADFWSALREPWRFGYVKGKRVQMVKNTFGSFLAWDFGKPRGITIGAAMAISLPAVIAIGTIVALTIYAKGKTGGR